jgi:DNA modification methylase
VSVTILQGDVREMLATLEPESVQVCVTSPPYFALRDYGVDGQIGLEKTPAEFIAALISVFEAVRRVLRPDGVCFVNLGDSYQTTSGGGQQVAQTNTGAGLATKRQNAAATGIPAKNLLLMPERFAIAMQDAGWIVRSRIAWCKKSAMPESVRDRPTSAWEPIYMFTKQGRYFWDQEAVRTPHARLWKSNNGGTMAKTDHVAALNGQVHQGQNHRGAYPLPNEAGANLRNYWLLGPEPSREAHYAAFPSEIPRRCILAATSQKGQCPACGSPWVRVVERDKYEPAVVEAGVRAVDASRGDKTRKLNGKSAEWKATAASGKTTGWAPSCECKDAGAPVPQLVLDPFLGSGTTALVADRLERHAVGIELNPEYAEMARRRITNDAPMFADVEVA